MPAAARPTSTLVLLVRHGVTPTTGRVLPGRARGLHLSEDGRKQAEGLVRRLAPLTKLAAIYSSPLERARETAAPLAKARGMAVRVEPGLLECDVGAWTGGSLKRLAKRPEWRVVQAHPSGFRFPGGESFLEMQARASDTVRRLAERHRGGAIVAVSHADPIKAVITQALGAHLDHFQRLVIAPASVTAVAFRAEGTTVLTVNSMDGDLASLAGR
jgi:probable phosphoglycerate mutase